MPTIRSESAWTETLQQIGQPSKQSIAGDRYRPVPVEPELRDVGDHEQAGRGGAEVVRPVPAQGDVGRALRELAPVAAVPRPPAHLRRLSGQPGPPRA